MNEHTGNTHADLERQLLDLLYIVCVNRTNEIVKSDALNYNEVFCDVARDILEGIAEHCGVKYMKRG